MVRSATAEPDTSCATCTGPLGRNPINAPTWVQTGEGRHGGHYERRDFCTMACAAAAPQYVAPERPRQPKAQPVAVGDYAQLCAFLGQPGRKRTR